MTERIDPAARIIWVHVASLGEFEQGRPIIEQLRRSHPEYKIPLTFYSPSGFEIRKHYEGADYIFYLPLDTPRNVRRFLDVAHPEIAVFVKYEFWLNCCANCGGGGFERSSCLLSSGAILSSLSGMAVGGGRRWRRSRCFSCRTKSRKNCFPDWASTMSSLPVTRASTAWRRLRAMLNGSTSSSDSAVIVGCSSLVRLGAPTRSCSSG